MKILKENCAFEDSQDKSLPYSAFIVEYKVSGESRFDLVISSKQSEIFDHYYDKYKKDFVTMKQGEGRINPKMWNTGKKEQKKSKK